MEYPSNSHNKNDNHEPKISSGEPKKIEQIVKSEVVRRKKPLGKKFKETFLRVSAKDVASHVWFEVLVPAARNMAADAGSTFIDRFIYGDSHSGNRRSGSRSRSRYNNEYGNVDYRSNYNTSNFSRRDEHRNISNRARASHEFDEIVLESRVEAEEVIDNLFNAIEKYGSVTLSDLYEMLGVEPRYTDNKWGWIDFRGARVSRVRGGYLLDLPKPEPLD